MSQFVFTESTANFFQGLFFSETSKAVDNHCLKVLAKGRNGIFLYFVVQYQTICDEAKRGMSKSSKIAKNPHLSHLQSNYKWEWQECAKIAQSPYCPIYNLPIINECHFTLISVIIFILKMNHKLQFRSFERLIFFQTNVNKHATDNIKHGTLELL